MNIKEAKQQIKKTIQAYFSKDEFGNYNLEMNKQRPIFLMGPPGIGKTAIMQQIASELEVGLVSYSITHHTRQSALGLPFIVEKQFQGKTYHMTEYTMSEIVASVYREIEENGYKEGILFLDEMNCVSETLAPVMLQFLQYKVFGMHQIPYGWLVVTAGNPSEYNSSAREFDPVTWDRLKRIDIEPDLKAWKEYAKAQNVHPAVSTYLELHPEHFYSMEHTVDGNQFVTARGWEDLSVMLRLYEKNQIEVDDQLCGQYLQSRKIAEEFAVYYELFEKYQSDYQIMQILNGDVSEDILLRAKEAPFDEKITLSGMLSEAIRKELAEVMRKEQSLLALRDWLRVQKQSKGEQDLLAGVQKEIGELSEQLRSQKAAGRISKAQQEAWKGKLYGFLHFEQLLKAKTNWKEGKDGSGTGENQTGKAFFDQMLLVLKEDFAEQVSELKAQAEACVSQLDQTLSFLFDAFGNGTELLLVLSDLTEDAMSSRFISRYGSEKYTLYSNALMIQERQDQILEEIMDT